MQFIRDPVEDPFPFKYDRCSVLSEAALTSMSLQWTFITLEIQYLVLMREAWYSSWSESNEAECLQGYRALLHPSTLEIFLRMKKIAYQIAISRRINMFRLKHMKAKWYWCGSKFAFCTVYRNKQTTQNTTSLSTNGTKRLCWKLVLLQHISGQRETGLLGRMVFMGVNEIK